MSLSLGYLNKFLFLFHWLSDGPPNFYYFLLSPLVVRRTTQFLLFSTITYVRCRNQFYEVIKYVRCRNQFYEVEFYEVVLDLQSISLVNQFCEVQLDFKTHVLIVRVKRKLLVSTGTQKVKKEYYECMKLGKVQQQKLNPLSSALPTNIEATTCLIGTQHRSAVGMDGPP